MAAQRLLSAEWLPAANDRLGRVEVPDGKRARVQYTVQDGDAVFAWTEVIAGGSVSWCTDVEPEAADVELRWSSPDDAIAILRRELDNEHVVAATTMIDRRRDRRYEGRLVPLDILSRRELDELPYVRDGNVRVACEHPNGPFGTVYLTMSIKDGRVVDVVPTIDPHADVAISCGFGDLMRIRKQEITLLDTDAKIAGSQGALALFAGVAEHSLYRRAQLGCVTGTACDALATLGELAVRADYRAAIDAILDTSVPDRG